MTPQQQRALELRARGLSIPQIAVEMGIKERGLRRLLARARHYDPAVEAAMNAVNTDLMPHSMWTKVAPKDDEPGYSVYHRFQEGPEDIAERLMAALAEIPPIPEIVPPAYAMDDLALLYTIADAHLGLMSWGKETGTDWDTRAGAERVQSWVAQCVAAAPPAKTAILLDVGDLTHADDQTNQTPASKHQLDVDTRHFKTIETAIATMASATEILAKRHERVIVRILPGNHNRTSFMAVLFALAQRYRDNPRIEVQAVPGEFFLHEFGKVLIVAHHGDKAKADRITHFVADEYAEAWGRTKHRFLFTGHLHHHKSQDIGGIQWEQLRAVTPRDAYAYSNAYSARAQMQAIVFHKDRGEVQRVKIGCS